MGSVRILWNCFAQGGVDRTKSEDQGEINEPESRRRVSMTRDFLEKVRSGLLEAERRCCAIQSLKDRRSDPDHRRARRADRSSWELDDDKHHANRI